MPSAKVNKEPVKSEPVAWENPLIPNKKLRAFYATMVELRLLDESLRSKARSSERGKTVRGDEGCRVSTTLDLQPGDLTSDGSNGTAINFLRGADLAGLLTRSAASGPGNAETPQNRLPATVNPVDRLYLAMGAAFALKTARKGALLIAYVSCDELKLAEWKQSLSFAAEQALPIIFVVLPENPEARPAIRPGQLSLASSRYGVPGIPVDAGDPVALYRVAQESTLRARAGGPVLMECIAFRLPGRKAPLRDPIETMQEFLLRRGIVDKQWLGGVETRFMARLKAPGPSQPTPRTDLH